MSATLENVPSNICAVWSKSSLGTFGIAKDAKFFHADNEVSDLSLHLLHMSDAFYICIRIFSVLHIILYF